MKKVISVILLLALCIGCFAGCAPKEDAALNAAAEYLYAMYKDSKATTDADYTVVSQIRIDDVVYPITWTSDKADNVQAVAGDNGMTTIKVTAAAEDINYKLIATLKNADGLEVSVSFDKIIPAKAVVAGKTIVLAFPKDNQFVSVTPDVYTSSSGSVKNQMDMTENEAEAVSLQIVENSDGTISFVSGEYYLYADGTHATFVKEQGDNTKFVLEAADTDGGYFIKCAYATYSGKAQYLEVYSGNLCSYGMGSDPSIYIFKLQESTVATGVPNMEGGNNSGNTDNNPSTSTPPATNPPATNPPASGSKVVISFPKDNKFITGTHEPYTSSSSGKTKMQLALTAKKAEAIALEMIKNSDNTVTFKASNQYLYADGTDVKFVTSQGEFTKFVLENADGGYFIKCATANYQGKAQYLEVYSDHLTCYGMGTDPSIYVFKLENATGANGSITTNSGSGNSGSGNSGSSNSGSSNSGSGNSGNTNTGSTPTPTPAGDGIVFDFTSLDKQGVEIQAAEALDLFNGVASGSGLTAVSCTKIYNGNSTGGAHPNAAGFIRCGKSDADGELVMTFNKKVAKVEVVCHDWYAKSEQYPTNNHQIAINGGTPQLAPYNETGAPATLTFNLDGSSNVVDFDFSNLQSGKTGRVFVYRIVVTFAN